MYTGHTFTDIYLSLRVQGYVRWITKCVEHVRNI